MCKTYKHHEACVIAKALHNGMEVKVVSSKFVLVQGKITNNTDVSFCKQYPELKAICIVAWNISLKNMSACVNISVQFKDKTYNDAWGCFKIPNKADDLQTFETLDSEDIDAVTDSFGSDDVDDESDTIDSEDIDAATDSFGSDDGDDESDTIDSEDIDAVTDSFGSDDGDDDSDTIELDEISMFGGENNDPSTRLQRAMLTFLKSLQQQTVL
ncbi:dentin sialophosphoprotein-like [Mya arenaria]|uniref:dentin sialophosphoprotein-like n=1 Tax=Mya arenaria TaxID=6604 RepID=UPI0022E01021|nr:dentin sialophosphoprotein-like [Mya arenaria]